MSPLTPARTRAEKPPAQRRPGLCRFYLRFLRPGHGSSISPSTHRRQRFRVGSVDAGGMTKPSSANAGSAGRVRRDVEHDIVWTRRVAAHTGRDVIQFEIIADAPTDVVVSARGVAAYPDGPDYAAGTLVQREPSTEDVHAADLSADHRIARRAVACRWPHVPDAGVDRIAVLQAVHAAAGLDRRIEIGRR